MNREDLLLLLSTPLYVMVIGLEMLLSNLHHRQLYSKRETLTNLYLMAVNIGIDLLTRTITFFVLSYCSSLAFFHLQNPWLYWLLLIPGIDFCYYWLHRLDHASRLFWAIHVTHHSSEEFNLTTGFRSSVFEPLYRFLFYIPLAFCGFSAADIFFVHSLVQIYGILVHTQSVGRLGWFEYLFVTPSHHRVHHASNLRYIDKNLGMFLIIWDKFFGTFEPESKNEPIVYGLAKNPGSRGPVNIIFHEFYSICKDIRRPLPLLTRIKYIFYAPGWSHDGSSKTAAQLRRQQKTETQLK
jgi:sterol desaturase/sphingolipid hydroxylase (fatty acid hydroxylase superfamily)